MTRFNGGKAGSGTYQFIINQIPPHRVYIEGFLGGGAIMKIKKPAPLNIGIDLDPDIIKKWQDKPKYRFGREDNATFYFYTEDFTAALASVDRIGCTSELIFLYLDPPYIKDLRRSDQRLYKFEMTNIQHLQLLEAIKNRNEKIMISGYNSELYNQQLAHWRKNTFEAMTSAGIKQTECIWMNYPEPTQLHDYSQLGEDRTDRQRIKRKRSRMLSNIKRLPQLERAALLEEIQTLKDPAN